MKILYAFLILASTVFAGPIKNSDLRSDVEEPRIPGTQVPIENMNTAPTSPELDTESKEFRNTLRARKQKQQEIIDETDIRIKRKRP